MRFSVQLKFDSPKNDPIKLGISYQAAFLHLLKTGLSHTDQELFNQLYKKNTSKLFTLAVYFPQASFSKSSVTLGPQNNAYWQFSTADSRLALSFYNAFTYLFQQGPWSYNKFLKADFSSPRLIKEAVITTNLIKAKTASPLVVRQDNHLFLSGTKDSDLDNFNSTLQGNMLSRFKDHYSESICNLIKDLEYTPINVRKTVVKSYDINVEVTVGTFILRADPILLNLVLKNGLGIRTGSFSGFLEYLGGED